MILLRSLIFNLLFLPLTAVFVVAGLPVLLGPPRWIYAHGRLWARTVLWLLAVVVGLRHEVRGRMPPRPAIVASKHQSAWDTLVFQLLVPEPAFVLKRELVWVPLFGLYILRTFHVPVDRAGGGRALRRMLRRAEEVRAAGHSIVIFPEGTRTAPGADAPYQPGIAALYQRLGLPVVPVALNSGLFWGRRTFVKRPGRIVVEFLEPIPAGLDRMALEETLRNRIEAGTARLVAEATGSR